MLAPPVISAANEVMVAVVSDLHAYDHCEVGAAPSHLCTLSAEDQPSRHPITGLLHLIEQEDLQADYLLCCGDMTDRARPAGIQYVWRQLHRLKEKLGARLLVATPGNHDLDSRYVSSDDAKGVLQSLTPSFPFADEGLTDKFWARNYAIIDEEQTRLVVLNTSAYHGTKPDAYQHGRIAVSTFERLRTELDARRHNIPPVNILLCHHHPQRFGNVDLADYSEMKDGHLVLELLGSGMYGDWIVVHGHKHYPRLAYASGSASAPVIFSAGSLCANLYLELQNRVRNQFYLIRFPWAHIRALHLGMAGTFRTWDWDFGHGWLPAATRSGLPAVGAFGYKADSLTAVARQLASAYSASGSPIVSWNEMLLGTPQAAYLMPSDLDTVVRLLRERHNLVVVRDELGRAVQVGSPL